MSSCNHSPERVPKLVVVVVVPVYEPVVASYTGGSTDTHDVEVLLSKAFHGRFVAKEPLADEV
jgi:hypothetical protein